MATAAVHGQPQEEQQRDVITSQSSHGSVSKQQTSDGVQKQQLGLRERIAAAIVAAAASACVVNPLDVVKVRMQALASQSAAIPLQQLQHQPGCHYHSTPIRSLHDARYHYHGVNHFIGKVMGSNHHLQSSSLMHCACPTAGAHSGTGVLSWENWSEIQHSNNEYLRSRYQQALSHTTSVQPRPLGIVGTIRQIVQQEGLHSLWRGLDSALLMSIPTVLLYYPLYDIMLDKLRSGQHAVNTSAMYHVSPMISGVVARATTALVVAPFEYVRTRQQAGSLLSAHAGGQSTWQTLKASLLKGGSAEVQLSGSAVLRALPTLWTGLAPTIARDVPFSAIYWGMVEPIREGLTAIMASNSKQPAPTSSYLHGHGSHGASHTQPATSCSTHQPSDNTLNNVMHAVPSQESPDVSISNLNRHYHQHSVNSRQPQGQTREHDSSQTGVEAVNSGALSPAYGQLVLSNMLAGSTAGASAAAITTPFDVVKTNMQLAQTNDKTMMNVLQSVYRQQGMKGLFVGVGPRAVRCAPACAIVISCYEVLKAMLGASA